MKNYQVVLHLNNNPGSKYVSRCGKYKIDEERKSIVWQNGYPVIAVDFTDIPDDIKWKLKK